MSKIVTFITLVDQAEEAAALYTSVFPRSRGSSSTASASSS